MGRAQPTLEDAWAVATRLPPAERRTLAKELLRESGEGGEDLVVVVLHRFSPSTQARLDELMTKSNEGTLTPEERSELTDLVAEYERLMLDNSQALLRASQPELFDETGQLVRTRLNRSVKRGARTTAS